MHLEKIVSDRPINFGDSSIKYKDIIIDVFDKIYEHEKITETIECDEYFKVTMSECDIDDQFDGAFITCPAGSYLIHDLQEQHYNDGVITVLYYNLSKILNK